MLLCNWENLSPKQRGSLPFTGLRPKAPPKRRILCAHYLDGGNESCRYLPTQRGNRRGYVRRSGFRDWWTKIWEGTLAL